MDPTMQFLEPLFQATQDKPREDSQEWWSTLISVWVGSILPYLNQLPGRHTLKLYKSGHDQGIMTDFREDHGSPLPCIQSHWFVSFENKLLGMVQQGSIGPSLISFREKVGIGTVRHYDFWDLDGRHEATPWLHVPVTATLTNYARPHTGTHRVLTSTNVQDHTYISTRDIPWVGSCGQKFLEHMNDILKRWHASRREKADAASAVYYANAALTAQLRALMGD